MKIEVSTVAFIPYYGLLDAIKAGADIGFKIFELPGDRPHAWPKDLRRRDRRELKRFLDDNGLLAEIISIDGSYLLGPGMCSENEDVRQDIFSYIKESSGTRL